MYLALFLVVTLTVAGFLLLPDADVNATWKAAASFLLSANVVTWLMFCYDKRIAGSDGTVRVPENTLLMLAVAGGLPSTLLAMQVLRHKRAKARFKWALFGWSLAVYASIAAASGVYVYYRGIS